MFFALFVIVGLLGLIPSALQAARDYRNADCSGAEDTLRQAFGPLLVGWQPTL